MAKIERVRETWSRPITAEYLARQASIAEELNRRDFRTRAGSMWTPTGVFALLPRLIEIGPRMFRSDEWIARREKILHAR